MKRVFIVSANRTPIASFLGSLSKIHASKLGSLVIKDAIKRINLDPLVIDKVIMGNVLSSGLGQAPARQAAIFAGLSDKVPCLTINKVCGSGLESIILGVQAIKSDDAEIVLAGGMENMSLTPYALTRARAGYKLGAGELVDLLIHDGLTDPYNNFHMGEAGELCAREYKITREEQDEYATESYKRAISAINNEYFKNEITPVDISQKGEKLFFIEDEEPKKINFEKIPALKPVFAKDGTITAANASSISDGAACVILVSEKTLTKLNLSPLAEIIGYDSRAQDPAWFTTAPAKSIEQLLLKFNLNKSDIDLFEINEAFSIVPIVTTKLLNLDHNKVNINGGAVSLGHPIGASGTRIVATLINSMHLIKAKRGVASICIGGGEALSLLVSNPN